MPASARGGEKLSLKEEMDLILGEARTVLPGIQALVGFQTVGVLNQRFTELPDAAVLAYLVALVLLVLASGLVMTPAAYHRVAEPDAVTPRMIEVASRLLAGALLPLSLALAADVGIVLFMATRMTLLAVGGAGLTAALLLLAWFVLPWYSRRARQPHTGPAHAAAGKP